ncbi:PREDICTED: uncharacterized protein LOC104591706 isoform X1 [Nelumbo nucifera]|uniref:Uncharacterized protein LOC104591706 isoform X1 n=1 Tax=Nelumbo nucifera TaxID=4432 RepID=A0A1U7Z909_NELNU|nr:PREDICTED: uncharacterized protein LOC104591706 isoform X1 [Nelumbo nucifera]
MEVAELQEALRVLDSSVSRIKWRLRAATKRRLEIDILALCTGLRPVVMVDYGGKMPELQDRLCTVLELSQKESSILGSLKIMVLEDMIYLIHVRGFAQYVESSLKSETKILFVDLQQDPPKMMLPGEQNSITTQFMLIQRFFASVFPVDGMGKELMHCKGTDHGDDKNSQTSDLISSQSSLFDLSGCIRNSQVTLPTLNGWLLGYPVVYLFGKEQIADAIYNLSTKSLHLFKILICRNGVSRKGPRQEELMSFSVPYDLSMGGKNEPWAEEFLASMMTKWERCKQAWGNLQMEVSECYPQAVVL